MTVVDMTVAASLAGAWWVCGPRLTPALMSDGAATTHDLENIAQSSVRCALGGDFLGRIRDVRCPSACWTPDGSGQVCRRQEQHESIGLKDLVTEDDVGNVSGCSSRMRLGRHGLMNMEILLPVRVDTRLVSEVHDCGGGAGAGAADKDTQHTSGRGKTPQWSLYRTHAERREGSWHGWLTAVAVAAAGHSAWCLRPLAV